MIKFFKKYHKWLGIILSIFILLFSISGIILNHREVFSGVDVNRNLLPKEYRYYNWNNAAVKGTERISSDSVLIYGNIGVWLTDSSFSQFVDFNSGFPKGIDNRKISKVFRNSKGDLFAATFFGLFQFDFKKYNWSKINLPIHEQRIVDLIEKGDTLLILSRSELLLTTDLSNFSVLTLPQAENYNNKIGLFKTLWVIHSGEIWGMAGKLIVDFIGLIFIFLTITGLIFFINPHIMKWKRKKGKDIQALKKSSLWNLKWHNKIGWTTLVFLVITTITGMFLRPPLLIAIANAQVSKIPKTILDSPNPWFDKLRRIFYDEESKRYLMATLDGIFYSDDEFNSDLTKFPVQPPASVMGVNVFEKIKSETYLVGSFEGLFLWQSDNGRIIDHITKEPYQKPKKPGPPIGEYLITGMSTDFNNTEVYFDYNRGAIVNGKNVDFVEMPVQIKTQPMSLWNVALEFHTARIYSFMFGSLYILVIPLFGLLVLFILISGFIVWYKRRKKLS